MISPNVGETPYRSQKPKNDEILNKIIKYLECYLGKRNLGIDILFSDGIPQITFSI